MIAIVTGKQSMIVRSIFPRLILLTVISALSVSMVAGQGTMTVFPSGTPVKSLELPGVMCREWVEVTTEGEATQLNFWDIDLEVEADSRILLGVSSSAIYALTLDGQTRTGKRTKAKSGQIMVWSHYGGGMGGKPSLYSFSAERLLSSFTAKGVSDDTDLKNIATVQKRKRFWGRLRPTGFNVATPVEPELEELREDYQTNPELIGIKRASRDKNDYAKKTAERFIELLGQGDAATAGLLISPSIFLEGSPADQAKHLLTEQRMAFANHLVRSGDYKGLGALSLEHLGEGRFAVTSGERSFLITLEPYDDGLYVSSLKVES